MRQSRKRAAPKRAIITIESDDSDADSVASARPAAAVPKLEDAPASVAANNAASSSRNVANSDVASNPTESEGDSSHVGATGSSKTRVHLAKKTNNTIDQEDIADDENTADEVSSKKKSVAKRGKADSDNDSDDFIKVTKKRKAKKKSGSDSGDIHTDSSLDGKSKKKRRRIKHSSDDDTNANQSDGVSSDGDGSPSKGRKNIRKVIKSKDLEDVTKRAAREEAERKKRIEERQKLYNEYYDDTPEQIKELDKLILDFDEKTKEEFISVDKSLVRKLKPHQGQGVKFMWDTCFESIKRIDKGPGSGCILAHCMGLGKSLQVVTLVHTLLAHSDDTKVEKVLVICPLSTVLNWVNEFKIWLKQCAANRNIEIYEISK